MPVSRAFAEAMDLVILPNARLRPLANAWTQWSTAHLTQLAGLHRCGESGVVASTHRLVPCPLCISGASPVLGVPHPDLVRDGPHGVNAPDS